MPSPVTFHPNGPEGFAEAEAEPLPTAELIEGSPLGVDSAFYERPGAGVRAGIWRSGPYTEWYADYPCDELMHILEGHVYIETESESVCYGEGATFLLPKGFRGYWRQPVDVRKYYLTVE